MSWLPARSEFCSPQRRLCHLYYWLTPGESNSIFRRIETCSDLPMKDDTFHPTTQECQGEASSQLRLPDVRDCRGPSINLRQRGGGWTNIFQRVSMTWFRHLPESAGVPASHRDFFKRDTGLVEVLTRLLELFLPPLLCVTGNDFRTHYASDPGLDDRDSATVTRWQRHVQRVTAKVLAR